MTEWQSSHTFGDSHKVGDNLRATVLDDGVTVSIQQPWIDVFESGFGATCSIRMSPVAARDFAHWLIQAAEQAEC